MIEFFFLASGLGSGCVERDARSMSELIQQKGRVIVECAPKTTDVFVDQQILVQEDKLTIAYRFDSAHGESNTFYIKNCLDVEPASPESNQGITQDLICDGTTYHVDIGEGAVVVVANESNTVFRHQVDSDAVTVNGLSYVLTRQR